MMHSIKNRFNCSSYRYSCWDGHFIFYINALQDAVQKVVQDPIYGSVVSQDYAMLSEKMVIMYTLL